MVSASCSPLRQQRGLLRESARSPRAVLSNRARVYCAASGMGVLRWRVAARAGFSRCVVSVAMDGLPAGVRWWGGLGPGGRLTVSAARCGQYSLGSINVPSVR